jgi:hypothetical protein
MTSDGSSTAKRRRLSIFTAVYCLIALGAAGLGIYAYVVERIGFQDARVWAPVIGAIYFSGRAAMTWAQARK